MKKVALAAALSVAATTAFAGNMSEPVMEPEIIVEETTASSSGGNMFVPILLFTLLAVGLSS